MKLTYEQVRAMNDIQVDILKEFIAVCNKLSLKYYMVHGSLLGAVTRGSFFPYDDDIDVAMPRKDYDILMDKGPALISNDYFVQSCQTESEFPLAFGKIRNNNTAFIQTVLKNLNVNMGIYIDIFPIDYYPEQKMTRLFSQIKEHILSARISTRIYYDEKQPRWRKISRIVSVLFCPSWRKAVTKKATIYKAIKPTKNVIVIGGKPCERGIPDEWFSEPVKVPFEGILVSCPKNTDQYLKHIYGDYKAYNPVHEYLNEDGTLTVSAYIFDLKKSYKEYRT